MVRRALWFVCLSLAACDCGSDTTPSGVDSGQPDSFVPGVDTGPVPGRDLGPGVDSGPSAMDMTSGIDMMPGIDMTPGIDAPLADTGPIDPDSRAAFCMGNGPVVIVSDNATGAADLCTGEVAAVAFRYAMCVCEDVTLNHSIVTDSFDSRVAPYNPSMPQLGGSVGINGRFQVHSQPTIGGSLFIAGEANLQHETLVKRDLHVGGRLDASSTNLTVDRDMFAANDILARNLTVRRALRYPANRMLTIGGTSSVMTTTRGDVTVPPPCDCAASSQFDVAEFVRAQSTRNDNLEISLDANGFQNTSRATTLNLPCGRFYINQIGSNHDFTINVTARTALFVNGQFRSSGPIRIDMSAPGSELDLFVAGDLVANQRIEILGNPEPRRVRLYFGGNVINLSATGTLIGNIYAPRSELVATSVIELFGSIFVRRINASERITVHYDSGILRAADGCFPDPPRPDGGMSTGDAGVKIPAMRSCNTCRDCANNACSPTTNMCAPCTQNSDCCAPLICYMGGCYPDLI